jgi:hypothetical protein
MKIAVLIVCQSNFERIGLEHPDITKFLLDISRAQKKHRDEIREMLMRSDPFALSLA